MKTTNRGDGGRDNRSLSLAELTRLLELNARPIAMSTALALMLCAGYLLLKPPAYRAKATLLLDEDHSDGAGVLGDLARLARPPLAVSEIEVLQSRSIAERTLDGSVDETPSRARSEHRLGLTTLVDEEPSTPLGRALGSGLSATARGEAPRLFAAISKRTADAPDDVRVEFLTPERMRLSTAGFFHRLWPSAPAPLECDYVADRTIQWAGLALRLEVQGNPAGRTFTLRSIAHEDALKMVLKSTRASETARGSGVIELTVDDTDPSRAADIANALCLNYLERSVKRSSRRASQTVDFIETQLVSQNAALAAAEAEVVRLEQQRPQSIDISKAAEGIIGQLNGLEVEIVHNELGRTALHETLELLQAGRLDAVSRLGPEIADPLSLALVQEIATLTSQSEQQDRHDTGPFKALLQAKLADLRSAAEAVALEIEAEQRILALLEQGDASALARTKLDERVVVDPLSTAYLAQFAELSRRLSSLALELTPEHPELVRVKHELQEVRARLQELERSKLAGLEGRASDYRALVGTYEQRLACAPGDERETIAATLIALHERTRGHLQSRLDGMNARVGDLQREQKRLEDRLGELPEGERAIADPKRRLEAHSDIVKFLLSRQQEAEIARSATVASAEFIDGAVPPAERHSPSIPLYLGGSFLLGLLFGLSRALARDSIDPGITTAAEIESALDLPVLGAVPNFRKGRCRVAGAGEFFLGLRDDPDGPIAEAYRSIRANLKFVFGGARRIQTIACTSSTQGEGKSVTNINLAVAFALGEKRVLLVDADMRRPVVHRYFDVPPSPGLSDVLAGRASWQECLHETKTVNLHVITAGRLPTAPGDLLASQACAAFVESLRESYDLIVFDLPPALAVADTEGFASTLDAMMLVCRSQQVTRAIVEQSADRLRSAGANVIGCLLNADMPSRKEGTYGYGYPPAKAPIHPRTEVLSGSETND